MGEISLSLVKTLAPDNIGEIVELLKVIRQWEPLAISASETAFEETRNIRMTGISIREIEYGTHQRTWLSIKHSQGRITVNSSRKHSSSEKVRGYNLPYIEFGNAQVRITSRENGVLHEWIIASEGGISQVSA